MKNMDTNTDRWVDIKGYEGLYKVSDTGEIYSVISDRLLKVDLLGKYPQIKLYSKLGVKKSHLIHRLAYSSFVGDIPDRYCINHIDGNKFNNSLLNLECVTYSENNLHALRTGLKVSPTGSKWHRSKLREEQVKEIKLFLSQGKTNTSISKLFNVHRVTISDISRGKTWRTG